MPRPHIVLLAILLLVASGQPAAAGKKQVRFVGIHPVPKAHGGGLCHIEAPHVHLYAPADPKLHYRDHRGFYYFVGDPVAYGWDGVRQTYYGHHPIDVGTVVGPIAGTLEVDPEFCYISGPHYHTFAPGPELVDDFDLEGGAYFFVGTPPPTYVEERPSLIKVNALYKPITYDRPIIAIEPPTTWIGITFPAPVVVVEPVVVRPRRPEVDVYLIGGPVVIHEHRYRYKTKHKHMKFRD